MKYLLLFEELKIKKTKKIYKHLDDGKGGPDAILSNLGGGGSVGNLTDNEDVTGDTDKGLDMLESVMKKLIDRFNLKNKVKYINSGTFGMAFYMGDDKVIKLTSNKGEALIAKNLLNKNIPHCVNYYDVVRIKKYDIYAILMDRAKLFSGDVEEVVDVMVDMNVSQCTLKEVKKRSGTELSNKEVKKIIDDYIDMYKSLTKNKVSLQDLHTGNMGYLNGKMVHFDMMGDSKYRDISKIKVKK